MNEVKIDIPVVIEEPAKDAVTFDSCWATQVVISGGSPLEKINASFCLIPLEIKTGKVKSDSVEKFYVEDVKGYMAKGSPGGLAVAQAYGALVLAMDLIAKEQRAARAAQNGGK